MTSINIQNISMVAQYVKGVFIALTFTFSISLCQAGVWTRFDSANSCIHNDGDHELAIDYCTRAIDSEKFSGHDLALLYVGRARQYSLQGKFELAMKDVNLAIETNQFLAEAFAIRCAINLQNKQFDLSIADCQRAIELNSKEASAYSNLGYAYLQKKLPKLAVSNYTEAIAINPKEEKAYLGRGQAFILGTH